MMQNHENICAWSKEKLWLFLDDSLSSEEKALFEAHAEDCAVCAQILDDAMHVFGSFEASRLVALPDAIVDDVASRITAPAAIKPIRKQTQVFRVGFGILAAAALILWMISLGEKEPPDHLLDWNAAVVEAQLDNIDARYFSLKYEDLFEKEETLNLFQNGADLELVRLRGQILDFEKELISLTIQQFTE